MVKAKELEKRNQTIVLWKQGLKITEISRILGHCRKWVYFWINRYQEEGKADLKDRGRRPKRLYRPTSSSLVQKIIQIRKELEKAQKKGKGFAGIGTEAIAWEMTQRGIQNIPTMRTIGRILQRSGMTRRKKSSRSSSRRLPRVFPPPRKVGEAQATDLVGPRHLKGPKGVTTFHSFHTLDRFSHAPVASQHLDKSSFSLIEHLIHHAWKHLGVPFRWQMDNEMAALGSQIHPFSISQVIRLALLLGVQAIFLPEGEVGWNAEIESFNGLWQERVLHRHYCPDLATLRKKSLQFQDYVWFQKPHRALSVSQHGTQFPGILIQNSPKREIPTSFSLKTYRDSRGNYRFPLARGRVTFIRHANSEARISILGIKLKLPRIYSGHYLKNTLYTQEKILVIKFKHQIIKIVPFPTSEKVIPPLLPIPRGRN